MIYPVKCRWKYSVVIRYKQGSFSTLRTKIRLEVWAFKIFYVDQSEQKPKQAQASVVGNAWLCRSVTPFCGC